MAREDGVLTWEYESRERFLELQHDITNSGWEVDKVEEVRRSGGLFSRQKIVIATLRPKTRRVPAEAIQEERELHRENEDVSDLWRPRESESLGNGNGNGNGHSNGNGNGHTNGNGYPHELVNGQTDFNQPESELPREGDDQYESSPEVDDSSVYSPDA